MMDVPSMKESTVDLAFTIMRDFADGALLEESAIDAERGIITSEYKVRDSAGYRVMKEVFSIMLDGTRIPDRYPCLLYTSIRPVTESGVRPSCPCSGLSRPDHIPWHS